MYFRTVRGETRIPSFTNSSLATLLAPHQVFPSHPADQDPQFCWNLRATGSTLPSPKQPPTRTVPPDHGIRPNYEQRVSPFGASHQDGQAAARRRTLVQSANASAVRRTISKETEHGPYRNTPTEPRRGPRTRQLLDAV